MFYSLLSLTTIVICLLLGLYVYENDKAAPVNRFFILFLLSTILWIFSNHMIDISIDESYVLVWSKLALIGPILLAYFFYKLALFFPRPKQLNREHEPYLLVFVLIMVAVSFTNLNVDSIVISENNLPAIIPGPFYPFFLVYFVLLLGYALRKLFYGYETFTQLEKRQTQYVSFGFIISAVTGIVVGAILPLFGVVKLAQFGPYFVLIFIFFTCYAILKLKMFDIKIIATQLLIFTLWIFVFARILVSENTQDRLINGGMLFFLIIVGTLLIRSVIKEVSQREKIEVLAKDLQGANDRLRELDRQKSEFVSFATHQLRAPLTAMKGYASLILEGDLGKLSNDMRSAITRIFDSSSTLAHIVDDYLNISRIELGTMKYNFENMDLKELVDNVIGELQPNIEKSKLKFEFVVERTMRYGVNIDRDKFKQIVANLIDNALKYTPVGTVTVSLQKKKEGSDAKIIFSVKDNGIGIAPEVMPKLFAKFTRADNGSRQNIHGTGLGLYVAKEIVTAHHGKIWAESAGEGKGSVFLVALDEVI